MGSLFVGIIFPVQAGTDGLHGSQDRRLFLILLFFQYKQVETVYMLSLIHI